MGKETKPKGCGPAKMVRVVFVALPKFHSDFFCQTWPSFLGPKLGDSDG